MLLLDEPTAALDQRARDAVEGALLGLRNERSASLILVTHDHAQARRFADRIFVLEEGRISTHAPASRPEDSARFEALEL